MTCDWDVDLEELMAEPPGGHNHGRKRGGGVGRSPLGSTGWGSLETQAHQVWEEYLTVDPDPPVYHRPEKPEDTIRHGTRSAYVNDRCRCDECRAAEREYKRSRRRPT